MSTRVKGKISLNERVKLLTELPLFSALTQAECQELIDLMHEISYAPEEILVSENALVDQIYIIARGKAEVSYQKIKKTKILKKVKKEQVPLAVLGPGDSIGLNDTGFFSMTGLRTATVKSLSPIILLSLSLPDLHRFLSQHTHLRPVFEAATTYLMRIKLIKQALPFSRLSHARLQWLANQVEEISLPKGKILFREGEPAAHCYLICSGEIEVFHTNEDGSERHIAALKSPTLFGEATLVTHSLRNASVRARTNCQLLVIEHRYLTELIATENDVAKMFMSLTVDRSRPLKNSKIIIHERETADKQIVRILKNPDNGNYFKLSQEGWFIWQELNGERTMQDITLALAEKHGLFAPNVVAALISKLAKNGFITNIETLKNYQIHSAQPIWIRGLTALQKIVEARWAIGDADKWLNSFYKKIGYLFFTPFSKIFFGCVVLLGMGAFAWASSDILAIFKNLHYTWTLLFILIPFAMVSVTLHELGHALATKSFGYEVHYMGIGWYWLSPIGFTDTSDMWFTTRWPRIIVNFAGIFVDLILGGLCSLLFFFFDHPFIQAFLWIAALICYLNVFKMLNPLQELDGYYVLMDILDKPHLRQSAVQWLVKDSPQFFAGKIDKKYYPEIIYWLVCIVFLILICLVTLALQHSVFKIFNIEPANILVSLALPLIVTLISSLGILADIRNQSD